MSYDIEGALAWLESQKDNKFYCRVGSGVIKQVTSKLTCKEYFSINSAISFDCKKYRYNGMYIAINQFTKEVEFIVARTKKAIENFNVADFDI